MAEVSPTPLSLPDLCPDVIFTIADQLDALRKYRETPIKNLALTNRHLRMVLTPYLFKRIHIYQPICQLTPTPLPRQYGRSCKVDMFGSMWWWCSGSYVSSKDALDLFECIRDLEELRTLEVSMMTRSVDMFVKAFVDTERGLDFRLNHIERLVVTRSAAFLAAHFPYLKSLVVQDEKDCVDDPAVSLMERLTPIHPQMSLGPGTVPFLTSIDAAAVWSVAEVAALVKTFPHLRHLRMRTAWRQYRATTTEIIATLSQALPELATLHMVKSSSIDGCTKTIFNGRPHSCSAAAYRKLLWMENERLRVDAENNTARCAFASIASLRECWLGERVARKLPDIDVKTGKLRWMWERNTEEDGERGRDHSTQWDISRGYSAIVVPSEIGM